MKIPVSPPDINAVLRKTFESDFELGLKLSSDIDLVDTKGRYLHWDKLRHLDPPDDLTSEQWWVGVKTARMRSYMPILLYAKNGSYFQYCTPPFVQRELHWLDRHTSGSISSEEAITNPQTRKTYLIRSLIEEAINSSQLEGASTTRDVAKEMIRQERDPKDTSEQMILNNYHAMQFIRDIKDEKLTPSIVFELQRLLTTNTLDEDQVGRYRTGDDQIHVVDRATQEYLHTPPPADELPERMEKLCEFANMQINQDDSDSFLHPVVKAIALHFMLAYDHPFCDGNGRTARALFYWSMANQGYWLMEYISISKIIKQAPAQYSKAYLHTETDDNDMTYFLIHQLGVVHQAIEALHQFLDEKMKGVNEAQALLDTNERLRGKLNFRQIALLRHALKHPRFSYVVNEHQQSHGISYDVARKDLLQMSDSLGLLVKVKNGKRYLFVAPSDLEDRISKQQ
jgi:Fic family protein